MRHPVPALPRSDQTYQTYQSFVIVDHYFDNFDNFHRVDRFGVNIVQYMTEYGHILYNMWPNPLPEAVKLIKLIKVLGYPRIS